MILTDLEICSVSDCESIRKTVMKLHHHWIRRKKMAPFYTLGAAGYLDASLTTNDYQEIAQRYNGVIAENFEPLLIQVRHKLANFLQRPVEFHGRLALPGFHIFLSHPSFSKDEAASAHWDLQFQKIHWPDEHPDLLSPISFTLPIRLPQKGGGMNMWEIDYNEAGAIPQEQREKIRQSMPRAFVEYSVGRMVVHSGLFLHQIAPMEIVSVEDERITLQGHALKFGNTWRLYW